MTNRPINPISATVRGMLDGLRSKERIGELHPDDRLDGKLCLVTGANSGLGRATTIDLVNRGAHVIMACRSGIPEAGDEIEQLTGGSVEMVKLDLANPDSITQCCDELRDRGVTLDRVVLNAGVVPRVPQQTAQGFEMMFGVHFVGNAMLIKRLLLDGVIPNRTFAQNGNAQDNDVPRIVCVSSESHRTGKPIDFDTLGEPVEYSLMESMAQYGHTKLVITAWMMELSRRLQDDAGVDVAVYCLCPGAINSNIARNSPRITRPVLSALMKLFFADPEQAAEPVVYLTSSPEIEGQTGLYLHLMNKKTPSEQAIDPEIGRRLWLQAEEWFAK